MSLFGNKNIRFGRFSDAYKTEEQYDNWDQALVKFEQRDYLESFECFLDYLKHEEFNNVRHIRKEDHLQFELFQGSKKISGSATFHLFKAEAKIAKTRQLETGFLQRLITANYGLKYGRYCLDDNNDISIVFTTYTVDASPFKLYYGLKEIALAADKQDDLLVEEFNSLESVNTGHTYPLPSWEKETKVTFVKDTIKNTLKFFDRINLDQEEYSGAWSYLLLETTYKLDYLITPEGFTMEALERMHRSFFAKDGRSGRMKNRELCSEFKKILDRRDEDILNELYLTISTFGITSPINHKRVTGLIEEELSYFDWYFENGYPEIARAISGYIVGSILFNYAIPHPDKDFLDLYYRIMEDEYIRSLDSQASFRKLATKILNSREITKAIYEIVSKHKARYPDLDPKIEFLKFDNEITFAKTYLNMICSLSFTEA